MTEDRTFTAFAGDRRIATGAVREVLRRTKARLDRGTEATLLVFDDQTGAQVDFDFRGTIDDVLGRLATHPHFAAGDAGPGHAGPGRPRLGVVSREVTLLPRHWEWLEAQPNGISAALRRLVDEARRREPGRAEARRALEAAGRFMTVMAGDRPGYEEASRALYAGDRPRLAALTRRWPADVRGHVARLVAEWARLAQAATAAAEGGDAAPDR